MQRWYVMHTACDSAESNRLTPCDITIKSCTCYLRPYLKAMVALRISSYKGFCIFFITYVKNVPYWWRIRCFHINKPRKNDFFLNFWILYGQYILTLKAVAEETGTSAWYHEFPASPLRDQISRSSFSSDKSTLRVPIPLPYMWVQKRRQSGLSGPKN